MQRTRSSDRFPPPPGGTAVPPQAHAPRPGGADRAHTVQALKSRFGFSEGSAQAIVDRPGYLAAHQALFTPCPDPLAEGADLGGLLAPLCEVCRAWFDQGGAREASRLLDRLLSSHPHAPAAHGLLRAYAAQLCGQVAHQAPGILAGLRTCALLYTLTPQEWPAFIELAKHLHPATGRELELAHRRQRMDQLQHGMLPWLKLPTSRDTHTQRCSLDLRAVSIAIPKAWKSQDLGPALQHFHQWLAWQLEDPQGLPWATLKGLIEYVADGLGAARWRSSAHWLLPLIQLSCQPALPLEVRAQLLETLIPWLPSIPVTLMTRPDKEDEAIHVECLRALCGLSEAAPGHCVPLWDSYRQRGLLKASDALHQVIQLLMDLLSQSSPQPHEQAVRWMQAYASLNLRPDASASPPLWRVLCGFLLKHCIAVARQNPWSVELFLQALHRLSTPAVGRSPVLQAIPSQLRLLLDQVAGLATPAERLDWLRQLDRHCALQPPAEGVDPHQHLALRGAIRCLLKRQGDPVPTGPTAITFFEQWTDYLLTHVDTLEARTVPQARDRLDALELEHQTLCSLGPRFGGPLDRLIGQLMQVEFIRLQAAAAE